MKNGIDAEPELFLMSYGKPKRQEQFIEECKKQNIALRELRFFFANIPLDERYDEVINFFKHFTLMPYAQHRSRYLRQSFIAKLGLKKLGFVPLSYEDKDFENDIQHKLLYSGIMPIAVQNQQLHWFDEKEMKNYKKLLKFESKNYIPNLSARSPFQKTAEQTKEEEELYHDAKHYRSFKL